MDRGENGMKHSNPFLYYLSEKVYGFALNIVRNREKHPYLDNSLLQEIKAIEAEAYPEPLRCYSDINTVEEFVDYCSCCNLSQIYFLLRKDWYFIIISRHDRVRIFDFAARNRRCNDIWDIIRYVRENFGDRLIVATPRESTGYQLLLKFEQRNRIKILDDTIEIRHGEPFHSVSFRKTC